MAEEDATLLSPAVASAPDAEAGCAELLAADPGDWSTPSTSSGEHRAIVALPPWARKGPDAEGDAVAAAPQSAEPPAAEPMPWWERSGQPAPTAPPSPRSPATCRRRRSRRPRRQSLESTLARQAMRPKTPPRAGGHPGRDAPARRPATAAARWSSVAAFAGVAAIGTPVMWKLAFASRPTIVSALPDGSGRRRRRADRAARRACARAAGRRAATPERRASTRICSRVAAEPGAGAGAGRRARRARRRRARPAEEADRRGAAPEPVAAAPVAAPEPAPLLVATPTPVVSAPATAAAPPVSVHTEAVPLGQIYEVSQVETRPSVVNRFDPVLPARINAHDDGGRDRPRAGVAERPGGRIVAGQEPDQRRRASARPRPPPSVSGASRRPARRARRSAAG